MFMNRSNSAGIFKGEKGKVGMAVEGTGKAYAGDLGKGWKNTLSVPISPGEREGEVSMTIDNHVDNRFLAPAGRFPEIEEDEKPPYLLATEYPAAKK